MSRLPASNVMSAGHLFIDEQPVEIDFNKDANRMDKDAPLQIDLVEEPPSGRGREQADDEEEWRRYGQKEARRKRVRDEVKAR